MDFMRWLTYDEEGEKGEKSGTRRSCEKLGLKDRNAVCRITSERAREKKDQNRGLYTHEKPQLCKARYISPSPLFPPTGARAVPEPEHMPQVSRYSPKRLKMIIN